MANAVQAAGSGGLYNAVLLQSTDGARQAFTALSGELHVSTAGVLVDESLYARSAILGRLRQASYGDGTVGPMAALAFGGPQVAFQDPELNAALGYAKSPMPVKALPVAATPDIAIWAQGFGGWGKFDSDGNAALVRRDLAGFMTGFDRRFGNWRGGLAAGYTSSRINTDGRGSATVDTGHVAAYGGAGFGALNLRGGAHYAFHSIASDRGIVFPGFAERASTRYDGGTAQVFGEAGYGVTVGSAAVEPFAGAAWVHLRTDGFREDGGFAALLGAANTFEVGYSSLGIRAGSLIPIGGNMVLTPRVSAAWQHAFNNVTPTAAVAFASTGTSFTVAGAPIARDALLAEAGLDLHVSPNTSVGVAYVGQIADKVRDHAAKGRFTWRF